MKPTKSLKTLRMLAVAVGALLNGKSIEFGGSSRADEFTARAHAIADTMRGSNRQSPTVPTRAQIRARINALSFLDLNTVGTTRRREPIWIGKPRPRNYAK